MNIDNLTEEKLIKTFKRLKKSTKRFSSLIVRDPVDFIDFEVDLLSNVNFLRNMVLSNNYVPGKPLLHLSPKNKGINRPTTVLDIFDALVYRFCIEQIEEDLLKETKQKNIRGGIRITANPKATSADDFYEKSIQDWNEHQKNLRRSLQHKPFLVTTDIASYFENINILILKDSIRSDVVGKTELLNLLFYFLENTKYRYDYEVNTFNGLLQESIDASRLLAYYFLKPHDKTIAEFSKANKAEYYRFVDDMSVAVESEVVGRKALKTITESLRRLNLVSSIEKTSIINSKRARQELFFDENDEIDFFQDDLLERVIKNKSTKAIENKITNYYIKFKNNDLSSSKNGIKVLKRFYTLATYGAFDLFSDEIKSHLITCPVLFSDRRIIKYTLRQKDSILNKILNIFIDYLYSAENLYQQLETNLLDLMLSIPISRIDTSTSQRLENLSKDICFNNKCLSDYSKALAALLIFKLNSKLIDNIYDYYLKKEVGNNLLRKHLALVSLVTKKYITREKVLAKVKKEQDISIQRLVSFMENSSKFKNNFLVKNYIEDNKIYIFSDRKKKWEIIERFDNVRARLVKEIIEIYG